MTDVTKKPDEVLEIKLTRGKICLIDAKDLPLVKNWQWRASPNNKKASCNWYARGSGGVENDKRKQIYMHRLILGAPRGKIVDHINGDSLDNRRENLRLCATFSVNTWNKKSNAKTPKKYRGVTQNPRSTTYAASCNNKYLGSFKTDVLAAIAHDSAALENYDEHCITNFPKELIGRLIKLENVAKEAAKFGCHKYGHSCTGTNWDGIRKALKELGEL